MTGVQTCALPIYCAAASFRLLRKPERELLHLLLCCLGIGGGFHGGGASGRCIGQSESGRALSSSRLSNDPAQASRFVRNELRLKRVLAVEQMEESSNCDVGVGPEGVWMVSPFAIHGLMRKLATRLPRLGCAALVSDF